MSSILTPKHIDNQRAWSDSVFGEGQRTKGVLAHLRQELDEVGLDPGDLSEWADLLILTLDGASRQGFTGEQIIEAYHQKMRLNHVRHWPVAPEGGFPEDVAVNHDRTYDPVLEV